MLTDKIIVPIDVQTQEEAIKLIELLPEVSFWKVGLELFISCGPYILPYLKEKGKNIFLDLKLHDIPNTMAGACSSALKYQVDLLTIHAAAGRNALEQTLLATNGVVNAPKLLGVTALTSLTEQDLKNDLSISVSLEQYVLSLALLCKNAGLAGSICSPLELEFLRKPLGNNFLLITPGIRPSWSQARDQRRTLTPSQAISAGADYLVIGRPLTAADDPRLAWSILKEELEQDG